MRTIQTIVEEAAAALSAELHKLHAQDSERVRYEMPLSIGNPMSFERFVERAVAEYHFDRDAAVFLYQYALAPSQVPAVGCVRSLAQTCADDPAAYERENVYEFQQAKATTVEQVFDVHGSQLLAFCGSLHDGSPVAVTLEPKQVIAAFKHLLGALLDHSCGWMADDADLRFMLNRVFAATHRAEIEARARALSSTPFYTGMIAQMVASHAEQE